MTAWFKVVALKPNIIICRIHSCGLSNFAEQTGEAIHEKFKPTWARFKRLKEFILIAQTDRLCWSKNKLIYVPIYGVFHVYSNENS